MHSSILQKIQPFAFHPTLHAFIYPLSFVFLGILYGSRVGSFSFVNTLLIFLYAMIFHIIDRSSRHNSSIREYFDRPVHIGLVLAFVVVSLAIAFRSTLAMDFLLLLNMLFLFGKNKFQAYAENNHLYVTLVRAFYYGIILNAMAFFMESHVMVFRLALASIPLLILHIFYLKGHVKPIRENILLFALRLLPYLLSLLLCLIGKLNWIALPFILAIAGIFVFARKFILPEDNLLNQRILSTHELLFLSLVLGIAIVV